MRRRRFSKLGLRAVAVGVCVVVAAGLMACGGGAESAAAESGVTVAPEEPACAEVRFGLPPADQGQHPPPAELLPGDVPMPDCPEERQP